MRPREKKVVFVLDLNKKSLIYSLLGLSILILFLVGTYISHTGSFFPYQPDGSLSYKSQVSALISDPSISRAELADEVAKVYKNEMEMVSEAKGQFGALGDAFGGLLNPVLSFFSILIILYTVRQNQIALAHSAEAIEQARDEARTTADINKRTLDLAYDQYKESAEQTRRAVAEQSKIISVQKRQKFESTFASLFDQNTSYLNSICYGKDSSLNKVKAIYENDFHRISIDKIYGYYYQDAPEVLRYRKFIQAFVKYCFENEADSIHYELMRGVIPDDVVWALIVISVCDSGEIDNDFIEFFGKSGFINKIQMWPSDFYIEFEDKYNALEKRKENRKSGSSIFDDKDEYELELMISRMNIYKENLKYVFSFVDKKYYDDNEYLQYIEQISKG